MNSNPQALFQELLRMGNNPQQITQALIQRNPQMQVLINQMQQSGLTTEQFIMQMAKQRGMNINPQTIQQTINQLNGMIPR
jgi:IS30 family transposase